MTALPILFYLLAGVAYAVAFVRRSSVAGRRATALMAVGVLAHTFMIGMQTMAVGHLPLVGTSGAVSAFVWLLGITYLYTEYATEERAMGVVIAPLCGALQWLPFAAGAPAARPRVLESPLFTVHVGSLMVAYAAFALAAVLGITYVLLFKEIKAKHLGFFYDRLPSLRVLDAMNARAVKIGWVFLTIGLVVGGYWVGTARQVAPDDARLQAMSFVDPKVVATILCWVIYSFHLYVRRAPGWSGRRSAWLSAAGFAVVLLNFLPVAYFFSRSHNF